MKKLTAAEEADLLKEEDLDLDDDRALGLSDRRVVRLLFGMRTEILRNQKQLDVIETTQSTIESKITSVDARISELSKKLLEPDTGLFARVRDLEKQMGTVTKKDEEHDKAAKNVDKMVDWQGGINKALWVFSATSLGVLVKYIWDVVITKK